jgi:hypothetical protein
MGPARADGRDVPVHRPRHFIHVDWIDNVDIGALLAAVVILQRDSIRERLGMRGTGAGSQR